MNLNNRSLIERDNESEVSKETPDVVVYSRLGSITRNLRECYGFIELVELGNGRRCWEFGYIVNVGFARRRRIKLQRNLAELDIHHR
ncbi:hypothetical protein Tco_0478306 [Tanacetum coccineum]